VKLITFEYRGRERVGRLDGRAVYPIEGFSTMLDVILSGAKPESLRSQGAIVLSAVDLLAPIPSPGQDVICLGLNYQAHAEESARFKQSVFERPEAAVYFSKQGEPGRRAGSAHPEPPRAGRAAGLRGGTGRDHRPGRPQRAA